MGYNASHIITNFVKYAGQPRGYEPGAKPWTSRQRFPDGSGSSLYYRQDRQGRIVQLDSYGDHFPLGILQLTPSGKHRRWLLNGDRWPGGGFGRTNEHNDMLREAVQRTGTPWFIVPFSALRAASIDMGSIAPVDVQPESYTYEDRTASSLGDVPESYRSRHVNVNADGKEFAAPRDVRGREAWPDQEGGWYVQDRSPLDGWQRTPVFGPHYDGQLTSHYREIIRADDGLYHWTEERHWLGSSLFRARYKVPGQPVRDGRGRILRWAPDRNRQALFVTAFDYNEPRPLWFMSELPRGAKPSTVAEALDALKPERVRLAEDMGLQVRRQGDLFAIPAVNRFPHEAFGTPVTSRQVRRAGTRTDLDWRQRSRYILGTNHAATDVYTVPEGVGIEAGTYARGFLRHRPSGRPADHVTVKLGEPGEWFLMVTNTVPRSFDGAVDLSQRASRSWSLGGMVD